MSKLLTIGSEFPRHSFGFVGENDTWTYVDETRTYAGVERLVELGVWYYLPSDCLPYHWERRTDRKWLLDLGLKRNPQTMVGFSTLEDLAAKIRKSDNLPTRDADLRHLDDVVLELLRQVSCVHKSMNLMGLLNPASTYFWNAAGDDFNLTVVVPDIGFRPVYNKPPAPGWSNHKRYEKFTHPDSPLNFLCRKFSSEAEAEDVRYLARMLRIVLEGSESTDNSIEEFPDPSLRTATSQRFWSEHRADCWHVLGRALLTKDEENWPDGPRITTAAELHDELAESPVSEHFLRSIDGMPVRRDGSSWSSWPAYLLGLLALAAVLAGGFWAFEKYVAPPPANLSPLCPDCAEPSPLVPILKRMEQSGSFVTYVRRIESHDSNRNQATQAVAVSAAEYDRRLADVQTVLPDFKQLLEIESDPALGIAVGENECRAKLHRALRAEIADLIRPLKTRAKAPGETFESRRMLFDNLQKVMADYETIRQAFPSRVTADNPDAENQEWTALNAAFISARRIYFAD